MSTKISSTGGGVSVLGLLGVAFVVLKLTGYIAWSWWWVTAPFWALLAVLAIFMAFVGIGWLIAHLLSSKR
jgi:hypothetical protein